jgi:hypothetical protein
MHNKFVIIDANSANANDCILWTGSANWTDNQVNTDNQNVIIFQDQTLCRSHEIEFEEMFGDTGLQPNASAAKFGPDKTDNFWNTGLFLGGGYGSENVIVGIRYNLLYKESDYVYSSPMMPFIRVYF